MNLFPRRVETAALVFRQFIFWNGGFAGEAYVLTAEDSLDETGGERRMSQIEARRKS